MLNVEGPVTIKGKVEVEVRRSGLLIHHEVVDNLVTNVGDQVYAQRAGGASSPGDAATGMQLGTGGGTAAAKSGAGAAVVTYISGSAEALNAAPSVSGGVITYVCGWEAGDVVTTGINEVVLVNAAGPPNSAQAAAATLARAVLAAFALTSSDTLTVTWTHTLLGA